MTSSSSSQYFVPKSKVWWPHHTHRVRDRKVEAVSGLPRNPLKSRSAADFIFDAKPAHTLPHFTAQRFWWSPFMVYRVRLFPWKSASYMELPSMYTYPDPIVNTTVDVPEFNFCAAPCSSVCTIERFATACVCYKVEEWTRLFSCVHHRKPLWSVPYFLYHRTFCTTVCAIKYQAVVHHSEP